MMTHEGFEFGFDESKCAECAGACCNGESGYIWVNPSEIKSIALFFGLEEADFRKQYLDKIDYKFSIKEKPTTLGASCVFFDEVQKNCGIYGVRPTQCRTFPFWDYFKNNKEEVKKECIGII